MKNPSKNIFLNLYIYLFWFFCAFYFQKGSFYFNTDYIIFIVVYCSSWIISSFISRKFKSFKTESIFEETRPTILSFILMLGFISITSLILKWTELSRIIVSYALFLSLSTEIILLGIKLKGHINFRKRTTSRIFTFKFVINLLILLTCIFYLFKNYFAFEKFNSIQFIFLLSIFICWLIANVFSNQFNTLINDSNYLRNVWGLIKSYIIFLLLILFMTFLFRIQNYDVIVLLKFVGSYSLISFTILSILILSRKSDETDGVRHKIVRATTYIDIDSLGQGSIPVKNYSPLISQSSSTLSHKLKTVYLNLFPSLNSFLSDCLNLDSFSEENTVVLRSNDIYNVEVLSNNNIQLFLNLHPLNDIRYLNQYFIQLNKKLIDGGVFVGRFEPSKYRHKRFLDSYPFYIAQVFYFIDFIWHRVFPKLPIFKKIYFELTKGQNRALPLAEGLGRLYYCGFEILDIKDIDNYVNFVAKKIKEPTDDPNPSYGPLFKMRRIGKNGKVIFVYKFRTMHPYSEYLQKFVYDKFNLKEGGKISNDFRITSWGKIFRKLWIDELPMLINFFKGELKLFGVRPLSSHYLGLYSKELQQKRLQYNPGLIPPYYVDLPKTIDEIMESELRYLERYEKKPIQTDFHYFCKALYNIIIKNSRSA